MHNKYVTIQSGINRDVVACYVKKDINCLNDHSICYLLCSKLALFSFSVVCVISGDDIWRVSLSWLKEAAVLIQWPNSRTSLQTTLKVLSLSTVSVVCTFISSPLCVEVCEPSWRDLNAEYCLEPWEEFIVNVSTHLFLLQNDYQQTYIWVLVNIRIKCKLQIGL